MGKRLAGIAPSQDAPFAHPAFLQLLPQAERLEPVGHRQTTPGPRFRAAPALTAVAMPAVPMSAPPISITASGPELQPVAEPHLGRLFRQAERDLTNVVAVCVGGQQLQATSALDSSSAQNCPHDGRVTWPRFVRPGRTPL